MINNRYIYIIILLTTLSMSAFCQKIDKIDRSKQRTEKVKSTKTSKGSSTSSTSQFQKTKTQTTQQKSQSTTAQSKSSKQSTRPNNSTNKQTTNRMDKPYLRISSNIAYFVYDGGSCSFQIESNNSWDIAIRTADWGRLERKGNTITLNVSPNNSDKSRTDYFTITSAGLEQKVEISQSGNPNLVAPYLNVSSSTLTFTASGGSETINITSNKVWDIKYATNSWGHLQRNGNSLTISVDANNSTNQRADYFVLKADGVERRIDIKQYGKSNTYSSSTSSSSYYGSNSRNFSKSYARRRWWKKNFKVGIDADVETNVNGKSGSDIFYSAGLLFRLGNCQQVFSVVTGVNYKWLRVMPENEDYYYRDTEWCLFGGSIVVPLYLRFNFARLSSNCKLFLGLGGEYGVKVFPSSGMDDIMNDYYYALSPQIGFIWRHFEMAYYWKIYPQSPFSQYSYKDEYKCNSMLGMSLSIYF